MHPRTDGAQRCVELSAFGGPADAGEFVSRLSGQQRASLRCSGEAHAAADCGGGAGGGAESAGVAGVVWKPRIGFKLDEMVAAGDYWEMLMPSQFTETSEALRGLVMDLRRGAARRSALVSAGAEPGDL